MATAKRLKVGILSANRLLRDTLARLIRQNVEVVWSTSVVQAGSLSSVADLILLDAHHVNRAVFSQLLSEVPNAKIIVINADWEELDVVRCIRANVVGFVMTEAAEDVFLATIHAVNDGQRIIPPAIVATLCGQLCRENHDARGVISIDDLSVKERQIFQLIIDGLTNKDIGNKLNITEYTVKNHVHHILQKLKFPSRYDLIRKYLWSSLRAG